MFCLLDSQEAGKVFRGFLFLIVIIILGVSIAEGQLNTLTQRQESAYVFRVSSDSQGRYSIYLLGSSYNVTALYSVGQFINNEENIVINTAYCRMNIPKYMEFDCKKELVLLEVWAKLLVEELGKCKQTLNQYISFLEQRFNVYMRQYR